MKKITPLLVLLLLIQTSYSQVTPDWIFQNNPAYNFAPTTNVMRAGSNTYICAQSIDADNSAYIFKLDNTGNILYEDSIHGFDYSALDHKRMVMDTNGSVYLCGTILDTLGYSKIRIIKYDSTLTRLADIVYVDSLHVDYSPKGLLYSSTENKIYCLGFRFDGNVRLIAIKFDDDLNFIREAADTVNPYITVTAYDIDNQGNIILGGYGFTFGTGEDLILSKLDTAGNVAWYIYEDGSSHSDDALMDLAIDNFNNIYVAGRFDDSIPNKVMKFNPLGVKAWTSHLDEIFLPKVAVDAAGALYVTGFDTVPEHEAVLYKFDSLGNLVGATFTDIPDYVAYSSDYFVSIQTDDSANVYLLNNADSALERKWFIAKFDSSLSNIFTIVYPHNIPNPSVSSSLCLIDDGFLVAGSVNNFSELRLVQFHETIPTGIHETQTINSFTVYPNPSTGEIKIKSSKTESENILLEIYNVNGSLVMTRQLLSGIQHSASVDIKTLPPGVYVLRAYSGSSHYSFWITKAD